jgi:acyl carrier protein
MNDLLESRVQRIFSDVFSIPVDQLQSEASPETVSTWDSLNHLNLVLALEQEFGIQFTPEEAMDGMASLGKIIVLLKDKDRGH